VLTFVSTYSGVMSVLPSVRSFRRVTMPGIALVIAVLTIGLVLSRVATGGLLASVSSSELTAAGLQLTPPSQAELASLNVSRARAVDSAKADVDAAYADDEVLAQLYDANSGQSCFCWVIDVTPTGRSAQGLPGSTQGFVVVAVDARSGKALDALSYSPPS
jgi:hypothetical protein